MTSHLEQAIRDAIEGGYGDYHTVKHFNGQWVAFELKEMCWGISDEGFNVQMHQTKEYKPAEILLDPAFWKALGKSRGWGKCPNCDRAHKDGYKCGGCNETGIVDKLQEHTWDGVSYKGGAFYYWHRLIDALAAGKSIEDFFSSLPPREKDNQGGV